MRTFFIEQANKTNIIKSMFNKVTRDKNKMIINVNLEKAKFETKIKIVKSIKKILTEEKSRQIVVTKKLKQDTEFINLLHGCDINICDSKWLFKQFTNEIIQSTLKDKKKEECEIWICINEIYDLAQEYIYKFAKEFKRINIVTNHIGKFQKIEDKLYKEEGILINITNNRRKSLSKAKLILNIDFPKETLNQFTIYEKADIISWEGNIKINKKKFNGKIIEDFEYSLDKNEEISSFIKENKLVRI